MPAAVAEAASESLFRKLAVSDHAHPMVRAQAWAEIAQMHDRREEYRRAMEAMLKRRRSRASGAEEPAW